MKKLFILFVFTSFLLYFILPKSLSLDYLSSKPIPTPTPTPTPISTAVIGLVGDLGLGRHITSTARAKNNFNWSFENISSWLQVNDFNLANLESPIIESCPEGKTGTFTFCGDTQFLPFLKPNKFIFNLANNHIFNYGQKGFSQTKSFLNSFSLPYFYSHTPESEFTTTTINGITFGFLGFDYITNPNYDDQELISLIKKYNSSVDWLIVSIHWGNEYLPQAEKWRIKLGREMVDAGADIIHGHHPHVWQNFEIYQDKPIFYSFGNFVFDQSWSYETSHSQIARLTVSKDKIISQELFPIEIDFNSQPKIIWTPPQPTL
jgi:poly-gamma-glutamate synthesis protein (capsule biosynthesis protein)